MNAMDVALICKALGDANRLEIVKMLSDGEKCGCKLPHEDSDGVRSSECPQGWQVAALLPELRNPDPVQRIYRGTDLLRLRL